MDFYSHVNIDCEKYKVIAMARSQDNRGRKTRDVYVTKNDCGDFYLVINGPINIEHSGAFSTTISRELRTVLDFLKVRFGLKRR